MSGLSGVGFDLAALRSAAGSLSRSGQTVEDQGTRLVGGWQTLGTHYQAPEAGALIQAISPMISICSDSHRLATEVGAALTDFAQQAEPILTQIEAARATGDAAFNALQTWLTQLTQLEFECRDAILRALGSPPPYLATGDGITADSVVAFLDAATLVLTVVNVAQGGLDPVTDGVEVAVIGLREAIALEKPLVGTVTRGEVLERGLDAASQTAEQLAQQAGSEGVPLVVFYKSDWTPAQRAAADAKVDALNHANLVVTPVKRSGTSAASRYRRAGNVIPPNSDVDHTVDLQLGGADDLSNLNPLDQSVNRSLGAQIANRLRGLPAQTHVGHITIVER